MLNQQWLQKVGKIIIHRLIPNLLLIFCLIQVSSLLSCFHCCQVFMKRIVIFIYASSNTTPSEYYLQLICLHLSSCQSINKVFFIGTLQHSGNGLQLSKTIFNFAQSWKQWLTPLESAQQQKRKPIFIENNFHINCVVFIKGYLDRAAGASAGYKN